MEIFGVNISCEVFEFFTENRNCLSSLENANSYLEGFCGLCGFFADNNQLLKFHEDLEKINMYVAEEYSNVEYGDYQTNELLADSVAKHIVSKGISPDFVIEPTCGKGNFIIASLQNFKSIQEIVGIEINQRRVWQAKFNIINYFAANRASNKPKITIHNCSFFDYDFNDIKAGISNKNVLIIGNPPWVTNSKLGVLKSVNLPRKSNFKKQNGIDAITGKSNFDIAEYITTKLIEEFSKFNCHLAFIVKNTVIRNIVFDQKKSSRPISKIEKYNIDAKKEFSVSVDASLLLCQLNSTADKTCTEFDFYSKKQTNKFGWINDAFVSNAEKSTNDIDGHCQFEWRQGVKHDCSKIMELEKIGEAIYRNKAGDTIRLEEDVVYGILKSSDLKGIVASKPRKHTIITQHRVGQDTNYLKIYPETYKYLCNNIECFRERKSSIYNGKPDFSIFGIGDYSFKPYKTAISGLYKTFHFTLVTPNDTKPVMLDDTCYFLGFDNLDFAVYTIILLNSEITTDFLKSISFSDAKRMITKDILTRIDLKKVLDLISHEGIEEQLNTWSEKLNTKLNGDTLSSYVKALTNFGQGQLSLF